MAGKSILLVMMVGLAALISLPVSTASEDTSLLTDMVQGVHPSIGDVTFDPHVRSLNDARGAFINNNVTEVPAWRGRFDTVFARSYFTPAQVTNKCTPSKQNCSLIPDRFYPYEDYIPDPTASTGQPVLKVTYPAGGWAASQAQPSGTLFYAYPYKWDPKSAQDPLSIYGATLEYEVYFPAGFTFVKGGKLPGLTGGRYNGRGCGGGADPASCFSYRVMWRTDGWGEAYLYVPHHMQAADFCGLPSCKGTTIQPCTFCDYRAGVSYYRGAFVFQTGQWTKLRVHMMLNTPNVTDGILTLNVNGKTVINATDINWRQYPDIYIEGVEFATWFGGGDITWAPTTDQYTLFRNFRVYYDAPADAPPMTQSRAASFDPNNPPPGWSGPVQIEEVIDAGL